MCVQETFYRRDKNIKIFMLADALKDLTPVTQISILIATSNSFLQPISLT
jgi:hypothetical protein